MTDVVMPASGRAIPFSAAGSDFAACFAPMLDALGWRGTARQAAAAAGPSEEMKTLDLRNALARLGFPTAAVRTRTDAPDLPLPSLFVGDDGRPLVLTPTGHFDGAERTAHAGLPPARAGWAYVPTAGEDVSARGGWFSRAAGRFAGSLRWLLLLTFFLNLLALTAPLFSMAVYDQVIATGDAGLLHYMAAGVVLALVCEAMLRGLRGTLIAHIAGRLEMLLGTAALAKLISLPLAQLERTGASTHFARLREVESLRWFFTGPLALAVLELPYVLLFLAVVAALAGWLALVPVGVSMAFAVIGQTLFRRARRAAATATAAAAGHQAMVMDILANLRTIKASAQEESWLTRFRERSERAAVASLGIARLDSVAQNFAQFANVAAGSATLAAGAILVMDGQMSVGALIASMVLVWRALAPFQMLFVALTRLDEIAGAVHRLDVLMAQPGEAEEQGANTANRSGRREGRITLSGVFLRYPGATAPALANLSFDIKPGEVVAIVGPNGSGKTSVLRLIVNLYRPQAGAVLIDGLDVRQMDPAELRRSLAYVPQTFEPFPGTVEDFLRLADPLASVDDIEDACARAGILDALRLLPDGLGTSLSGTGTRQLPSGLLKGVALARGWLSDASVVLLDEPGGSGDAEACLLDHIEMLRGRSTVLLVTHRTRHLAAADRVLVLNQGALAFNGNPRDLLAKMTGAAR
ncbi:MAG: ATP-binding cassette domain-containing protein [Azospirillum sp.]|nr:ATP-binding cassette domain-containing protein [Azospirillum sp.]